METTLISTIYDVEPVMICITKFSPKKVILLTEDNASEVIKQSEETLTNAFGRFIEIKSKEIDSNDSVKIASAVATEIEEEKKFGNRIVVNISGGERPQALGALFGAYSKHQFVDRIIFVDYFKKEVVDLPILKYGISNTKVDILRCLIEGCSTVKDLSTKIGISRGMTYNHIRELRDMGLINKELLEITTAGRLAIV
ncbi:bacterial regulatory protein, arsR family [Methanobrevibacter cuticularis]|uniref:Bacterial regulatory protein, arsR family n=1 Tax=Methanobrevibacter cuticularis TaxID=47311 RepID=A0A166FBZ9_9EURY|nr:CRISPR-associated CARF protein Csa3 [Methanobrevibacter cuticularis]KZX17515.1 bacterial regulatory protein, arsR family [Methanobrevibacter cuticularis]